MGGSRNARGGRRDGNGAIALAAFDGTICALTPAGDWVSPRRGFLFLIEALLKVFCGKFEAALKQEHAQRRLALAPERAGHDGPAWRGLLWALYRHD